MFPALGRFCYRHRRAVALGWLVLLLVGFGIGSSVFGRMSDSGGSPSAESVRGGELLNSAGTTGVRIVGLVDRARVDDPGTVAAVRAAVRDLRSIPDVATVYDYYATRDDRLRARDGRASLVVVKLRRDLPGPAFERGVKATEDRLRRIPDELDGATVRLGGNHLLDEEIDATVSSDLQRGEFISLPIALLVMIFIFGGLVAAGLPFLGAIVSIAGTLLLLLGFSYVADVSPDVASVVTVMGLGLSIDYCLLIVNRFREERSHGFGVPAAVERTSATAGRTIAFSALTVAVSLGGLLLFDDPTYRSFGAAGVGVVLVALGAALTLIPALLGLWGARIKAPASARTDDGLFYRLARRVQRRPLLLVVVVGLGLAATALPFLGARYQDGGSNLLPKSFETRQVADRISTGFAGAGADPVVVAIPLSAKDPRVSAYADSLRTLPGATGVSVADGYQGAVSAVEVTPAGTSQGKVAQALVERLRSDRPEFPTYVTGDAAYLVDFQAAIRDGLPKALGMIALATFVLLFLMTGSVLVPLKALVMNVLSLGASFGALVWVFQDGHLAGLLGFTPTGAIETWVPIIVFVFAFGLSMDYEVFLLARVKELYDAGYSNEDAVAIGLQRSGRIITSAALLIVIVFAGFAAGQMVGIKEMGLALALAVLVDATLVRVLLVPATMSLLGDWNWWAPGPLRRLHARFGLRESDAAYAPVLPSQRPAPDKDRAPAPTG